MKGADMAIDNSHRNVLVFGGSQRILDVTLASLRDLGFQAQVSTDFSNIIGRFDVADIDMIVFGHLFPADHKAELQEQIAAINPDVIFVDSLVGIPGVIVSRIQSVFNADQQNPTQTTAFTPDDRAIRVTLADAADVTVVVYWRTSFAPPDPQSDSLLLLDNRLVPGEYTVTVPDHIPPIFVYATVQIDTAHHAFSIATEPEPALVPGLALPN
jgi:hypothetical protein